jgi:hypothetical protein
MKVTDYLNIPYRIESEALETATDGWVRRVRLPELAAATAEAESIEDALTMLERRRIELIIEMLRAGRKPPVPRSPLVHNVTASTLQRLGLTRFTPLLDQDADELAAGPA